MRSITALALGVVALGACSRTIQGPTPQVTSTLNPLEPTASPARVCNAQGAAQNGWEIDLTGSSFAPLPSQVLTSTPTVLMPEVALSGPSTELTLSRDRVTFADPTRLVLMIPTSATNPAAALAEGQYTVRVTNPNSAFGELANALLVVPPPAITSASATGYSPATATPVQINGSGFRAGEIPTVTLAGSGLTPVTLVDVAVSSATALTATIPANTAPGTYDVTVQNPEGCSFTLPGGLTLSNLHLGALSMDPRFGWQLKNTPITVYAAPTGTDVGFSGGAPRVFIVAPLKTAPATNVRIPLRRVAFLAAGVITAVVPDCSGSAATPTTDATCASGIAPGGPYALEFEDPSGATGTIPATAGFQVLANEPSAITSIAPTAIDTRGLGSGNPLVITGTKFDATAKPQVVFPVGANIRACDLPLVARTADTEISAQVPTSVVSTSCTEYDPEGNPVTAPAGFSLAAGMYVIRVQNGADPAFADYSALTVHNPAANPGHGPAISVKLSSPRGDFQLVQATDDLGRHYLYALGGYDGTNEVATVEAAQITPFGDLGGDCSSGTCLFRVLDRTPMGVSAAEPRRGHVAFSREVAGDTSYLYVAGGSSGGATLNTVERAQVLRSADAPNLDEPTTSAGGTLATGTYYYQVSAITSDAKNPGGETLASDQQSVTLSQGEGTVKLAWDCAASATSYRIYRTVGANAVSGTEQLLTTVTAASACAGSPSRGSYSDNGSITPAGDKPLPAGAIGKWVAQNALGVDRANAAVQLVGGQVYIAGGYCSTASGVCPAANSDLTSVETSAFTGADLGTFSKAGDLLHARRRLALTVADAETAPSAFTSVAPDNTKDAWLLAVGGQAAGAVLTTNVIEVGKVADSTGVIAPAFANSAYNASASYGGWAHVLADYTVEAGPNVQGNFAFKSNSTCPGGQCLTASSFSGTLPSVGVGSYADAAAGVRFLSGEQLFRAYVYVAGGFPTSTTGTPTGTPSATLERLTY